LPNAILQQLINNQQVKVIILANEPTEQEKEEAAWHRLAAEQLITKRLQPR
jgi:precorrin-6x reductase